MQSQKPQQRRARNKPRKQSQQNTFTRTNLVPYQPLYTTSIMPPRKLAKLYYNDGSTVRNAGGSNFLVYSMRINDLYDPDPLILSGTVSNFKEMMQFYSYYKVDHMDVQWTLVNLESFPLSSGIVFSQTNLTGTITTLAAAQDALENDFTTGVKTISSKGGLDRCTFQVNHFDIHKLLGSKSQYNGDINYSGLGLATPSVPFWANFIVWAPTGNVLTNGYANATKLSFYSQFYGRTNNRA